MLPKRSYYLLGGALLLGIVAVFLMKGYLNRQPQKLPSAQAQVQTVPVVVTNQPVLMGAPIAPERLKVVQFPVDTVPPGSFRSIAEIPKGRTAKIGLSQNEPILAQRLAGGDENLFISYNLRPGLRALSIRVDDASGIAGFVRAGERVDIQFVANPIDDSPPFVMTLGQDLRVLAVDQDTDPNREKPDTVKTVTVEVSPKLSDMVRLAEKLGSVTLQLRHPENHNLVYAPAMEPGDVRVAGGLRRATKNPVAPPTPGIDPGADARRLAALMKPPGPKVDVIRGTEVTSYEVGRYP